MRKNSAAFAASDPLRVKSQAIRSDNPAMSGKHFIPAKQVDLMNWSARFNNGIHENAPLLGLSSEQTSDYNAKHNAMVAAYTLASLQATRGPARTKAKDRAVRELKQTARRLARYIRAQRQVSPALRLSLGLAIRKPGGYYPRHRRPEEAPKMILLKALERTRIEVRLFTGRSGRAKPKGVHAATIYFYIGANPPDSMGGWSRGGIATRTRHVLAVPLLPAGTIVSITACWMSTRGEEGPGANPVQVMIPLGGGRLRSQHRR